MENDDGLPSERLIQLLAGWLSAAHFSRSLAPLSRGGPVRRLKTTINSLIALYKTHFLIVNKLNNLQFLDVKTSFTTAFVLDIVAVIYKPNLKTAFPAVTCRDGN